MHRRARFDASIPGVVAHRGEFPGAAVSAVFRVATAPDRIRERRDMAREVCLKAGGEWVVGDGRREICKRA